MIELVARDGFFMMSIILTKYNELIIKKKQLIISIVELIKNINSPQNLKYYLENIDLISV